MSKIFYDTAIFFGGHALILGHKPEKLDMNQIHQKIEDEPQEVENFGLFDRATPNYTTYYPDVKAEDLVPKDDEFIEPVFRMLSNITVNARHNPIYFSADVLKKSMYKMIGQTVNIDHEMALGNAIGSVKSVEWQNAYTSNGKKIPAGFNAVLKIDGKSNPRIARGIMMDPPSIHANSVTVNFAWEKSHPKMEDNEFFSKLGSFDEKGKLIQRLVTEVVAYHETSLVSHGADPFAQLVKDGKIVKPDYAATRYPLSDQTIKQNIGMEYHSWDWKQFSTDILPPEETTILEEHNNNNNQNSEKMDKIFRLLETQFNLVENSLTEENYAEEIAKIKLEEKEETPVVILDLTGAEAIEAEITRLREVENGLPENLEEQLALAATAETVIKNERAEVERLYRLSLGDEGEEDATILALIAGADYKTLQSLHKQYDKITENQFGFVCLDCESHNVTRASANPSGSDEEFTERETDDLINDMVYGNKVDTSFIEGKK